MGSVIRRLKKRDITMKAIEISSDIYNICANIGSCDLF